MPQRFADVVNFIVFIDLFENELCQAEVERAEQNQNSEPQQIFTVEIENFEKRSQRFPMTNQTEETEQFEAGPIIEELGLVRRATKKRSINSLSNDGRCDTKDI